MKAPLLLLLLIPLVLAQSPAPPEIRGSILELNTGTPIPGVDVTAYEFAPHEDNFVVRKAVVSTITDANGVFSLKPGHFGTFSIGIKKEGYAVASQGVQTFEIAGPSLNLTAAAPVQSIRMSLTRPGTLTGRVIDRDGNAVRNIRVFAERSPVSFPGSISATTNAEGIFTVQNLAPGSYVVHIQPTPAGGDSDELTAFTESAFQTVDEDVEPSYWPGGVSNPEQTLPIPVAGGAIANVGTITIRKVPYYRVHISLGGACAPNERWIYRVRLANSILGPAMDHYVACRQEFLLTGIPPGAYNLAIWNGRSVDRWALVPFTITTRNTTAAVTLSESVPITGRVKAADGADLAKLGEVSILLRSADPLPANQASVNPDANGLFAYPRVPWKTQSLSVEPRDPSTYVKEIRYNGLPLRSQSLDAIAGSTLEILLDSQAASLAVTLKQGEAPTTGSVALVATSVTEPPRPLAPYPPFIFVASARADGKITFRNLSPGEYRVVPLPPQIDEDFTDATVIAAHLARANKIILARGEQKSIEVQLK
ncbi:MAG: carboxypeptidase regulatory-like domain-containing protein [Acidobacteriota bacterium]